MHVKDLAYQVCNYWRRGSTLRKMAFVACQLCNHYCNVVLQMKISILFKISGNSAEVKRLKEVFEVKVQHDILIAMNSVVCDDAFSPLESMGNVCTRILT